MTLHDVDVDASVAGTEEGDGTSHGMTFSCQCVTWHITARAWL